MLNVIAEWEVILPGVSGYVSTVGVVLIERCRPCNVCPVLPQSLRGSSVAKHD